MIVTGDEVSAIIATKLGITPTEDCLSLGSYVGGRLVAGVLYARSSARAVEAHLWVEKGSVPSVAWAAAALDYPFNQIGLELMVGWLRNEGALPLLRRLGFEEVGRVADYYGLGEPAIIVSLHKKNCRQLRAARWIKRVPSREENRVRSASGS